LWENGFVYGLVKKSRARTIPAKPIMMPMNKSLPSEPTSRLPVSKKRRRRNPSPITKESSILEWYLVTIELINPL